MLRRVKRPPSELFQKKKEREKGKGRAVIGEKKVRGDDAEDGMEPVEKQEAFKTEGSSEVCNFCQF